MISKTENILPTACRNIGLCTGLIIYGIPGISQCDCCMFFSCPNCRYMIIAINGQIICYTFCINGINLIFLIRISIKYARKICTQNSLVIIKNHISRQKIIICYLLSQITENHIAHCVRMGTRIIIRIRAIREHLFFIIKKILLRQINDFRFSLIINAVY